MITITFTMFFLTNISFWETYFHKIKSRETADHTMIETQLTMTGLKAPHQLSCIMCVWEFFLTALGQTACNKSLNKVAHCSIACGEPFATPLPWIIPLELDL
jgi:hypothetical protein